MSDRAKSLATADAVERKPLKYGAVTTKTSFVRVGEIAETAMKRAYPKLEAAAVDYGVSPSLMSRQMRNQDDQHLSFQRLWSMPTPFKLVLVDLLMEDLRATEPSAIEGEKVWRIRRIA